MAGSIVLGSVSNLLICSFVVEKYFSISHQNKGSHEIMSLHSST